MRENEYQAELVRKLKQRFPGCVVLKNDSAYMQGVPDLTIFYQTKWAMLEVKAHENAREQPNQSYYVELFDEMSYAAFIFPENEREVLDELQSTFQVSRKPRLLKRE